VLLTDWTPELAPSPRHTAARLGGAARLLRFAPALGAPAPSPVPLLVVPSMINRWYVVDLRRGASLIEALTAAGIECFVLDWGIPGDEDRYLDWAEVLARVGRACSQVRRLTGAPRVGLLGYCMGGTLAAIHTALDPDRIAALVDLAGPIDFSAAGQLGRLVDRRWFDADAIADAGNVAADQMQSGFAALRPTLSVGKWVRAASIWRQPEARAAFVALERWAGDNIPFPGEAYRTYIKELYQDNLLVAGGHRVAGRLVDLGAIRCPILAIVAERDTICPPAAATALVDHSGSRDAEVLAVPGGHVGAVVGSAASSRMYPATAAWLRARLANS
jgi:polyhydroxyalkanoate synthase